MSRPVIVLNMLTSVDGKITTANGRNVTEWTTEKVDGEAHEHVNYLFDQLNCDGIISGSETLMVYGEHWVELEKPLYEPQKSKGYIVFDGRGRINWYQTEGLYVVTREDVGEEYIKQLHDKNISYIQAGKGEHIDLPSALEKLYDLGFRRLGLNGGGGINGAFLKQDLIDEISLSIAPLAIGGSNTPGVFEGDELKTLYNAHQLELIELKKLETDAVWLYYRVKR
jgi:riboflavin biosynthesis pyrimidine reductase